MRLRCMYCACIVCVSVCLCEFSWCIRYVLSYFCLIIYQYHISFQIISYSLKFEDWTSSKVPEKSPGFPSWMSTISRSATRTAFCTNLGGPRMSTDMALLGGFLENRSFLTMFSMSNENFNFTKRCWMPTPTGLPWHHGTVLRRLRIHTLLQEIDRNRTLLDWASEFWGIRVHPFILRKNLQIWKFSCGTAFSAKSKGVFLAKEPWKIWTPCNLKVLRSPKSAPPAGCCWGNHENNPVRRNNSPNSLLLGFSMLS